MTIQINGRMYLNEPANLKHGSQGTITNIKGRGSHKYELTLDGDQWGYWYPESMLSETPPQKNIPAAPVKHYEPIEISSGLGINGINNDQSMPFIPSVRAIERVQKMHDTDTVCRRCGASQNFDGAMFTTLAGGDICDDCA